MRRPSRFGILDLGFLIVLATVLGGAACTPSTNSTPVKPAPSTPVPAASASAAASPATSPVGTGNAKADSLIGRWPGEGGAYMDITKKGDKYSVEISNLDGPKTYEGTGKGDVIEFTRNGKTETVKAGSGADTGMKGFEKETNCILVTKGSEGFCKR
ncbi:MAG TPA: hypothetical protein VMZ26_12285 [Pyrinomonadaceae bacterium]|nr:hypothetical protein [Pyrinomonadaceae bacterium]